MRFLVDAQLPPALARMLAAQGHHAEHVMDIGRGDASDRELWSYALEHEAVIITKDEDFHSMRYFESSAPWMVWVRIGNTRRIVLLERVNAALDEIVAAFDAGQQMIELR